MQNENDLIEFANDLRDQYYEMQRSYEKRIAVLEQKIQSMSSMSSMSSVSLMVNLKYHHEQFQSPRPFADTPIYTNVL